MASETRSGGLKPISDEAVTTQHRAIDGRTQDLDLDPDEKSCQLMGCPAKTNLGPKISALSRRKDATSNLDEKTCQTRFILGFIALMLTGLFGQDQSRPHVT